VTEPTANLALEPWKRFRTHFGLAGERTSTDAIDLVGLLFRCALCALHSPAFEDEHREELANDWARIPIPREGALLKTLASLGHQVAILIDPLADADALLDDILGRERRAALARPSATSNASLDLHVRVSYFGAARGKWRERDYQPAELPLECWGTRTGDLLLNDSTFLANVPEAAWQYELGGYGVVKKWLGYRQASRCDGRALTLDDMETLRSIVQRIAALLAIRPRLDEAIELASADAFTADQLGV
jgi:hypothetical protein